MEYIMVQVLILAAVAAFLFWRLSLVLGIRTGFEKTSNINIQKDSKRPAPNGKKSVDNFTDEDISDYVELSSGAGKQLKAIKKVENEFLVQSFVSGAKNAYEIILMAYEKGDLDVLKEHLAVEVYDDFKTVVNERANNGYTVDANFAGLREIRIRDVFYDPNTMLAEITVFFKCELTSVVKDKNNEIVEGSSSQIKAHTDVWTFGRKIGSADPAWKLIATGE